jgi:hypothetical protein
MKTVHQIFVTDLLVTALKIQAKKYLTAREDLEWRMIKVISNLKILNTEEAKFTWL